MYTLPDNNSYIAYAYIKYTDGGVLYFDAENLYTPNEIEQSFGLMGVLLRLVILLTIMSAVWFTSYSMAGTIIAMLFTLTACKIIPFLYVPLSWNAFGILWPLGIMSIIWLYKREG